MLITVDWIFFNGFLFIFFNGDTVIIETSDYFKKAAVKELDKYQRWATLGPVVQEYWLADNNFNNKLFFCLFFYRKTF